MTTVLFKSIWPVHTHMFRPFLFVVGINLVPAFVFYGVIVASHFVHQHLNVQLQFYWAPAAL